MQRHPAYCPYCLAPHTEWGSDPRTVEELDRRYGAGNWAIYRQDNSGWAVSTPDGFFKAPELAPALETAAAFIPLDSDNA